MAVVGCHGKEKKMKADQLTIIVQNEDLIIGHEWEETYLIRKHDGKILIHDQFYGDPKDGLISKSSNWAIIAGDHLTIWSEDRVSKIESSEIGNIHSMRMISDDQIEILTDPWHQNSAIWCLEIKGLKMTRVKGFPYYREKPYSDIVEW